MQENKKKLWHNWASVNRKSWTDGGSNRLLKKNTECYPCHNASHMCTYPYNTLSRAQGFWETWKISYNVVCLKSFSSWERKIVMNRIMELELTKKKKIKRKKKKKRKSDKSKRDKQTDRQYILLQHKMVQFLFTK